MTSASSGTGAANTEHGSTPPHNASHALSGGLSTPPEAAASASAAVEAAAVTAADPITADMPDYATSALGAGDGGWHGNSDGDEDDVVLLGLLLNSS